MNVEDFKKSLVMCSYLCTKISKNNVKDSTFEMRSAHGVSVFDDCFSRLVACSLLLVTYPLCIHCKGRELIDPLVDHFVFKGNMNKPPFTQWRTYQKTPNIINKIIRPSKHVNIPKVTASIQKMVLDQETSFTPSFVTSVVSFTTLGGALQSL